MDNGNYWLVVCHDGLPCAGLAGCRAAIMAVLRGVVAADVWTKKIEHVGDLCSLRCQQRFAPSGERQATVALGACVLFCV